MGIEKTTDLRVRTKNYSLLIIDIFSQLPKRTIAQVIGK